MENNGAIKEMPTDEVVDAKVQEALAPIVSALNNLATALNDVYSKGDVFTKQQVNELVQQVSQSLATHVGSQAIHVSAKEKEQWDAKLDSNSGYTKDEANSSFAAKSTEETVEELRTNKANKTDIYTKSETDGLFSKKFDTGSGILKNEASTTYEWSGVDACYSKSLPTSEGQVMLYYDRRCLEPREVSPMRIVESGGKYYIEDVNPELETHYSQVVNLDEIRVDFDAISMLHYPINLDGTIKDCAVNEVADGAFVIPEGFKDLLIRFTGIPESITFSGADASIADYGDELPTKTGDYLITVTRTKLAECYIRIITLEARA